MSKQDLYQVRVPAPGEHPSNEWAEYQAQPSSYYPAVVPYFSKPAGPKKPIKYTKAMRAWVRKLQKDDAAFREYFWIAGGIINRQGNEPYIIKGKKSYVPVFDKDLPQDPVGQPVTSVGNLVNVLEIRDLGAKGRWARIETVPTKGPWKITPKTHPWLFNNPFSSIRTGDNQIGNAIDSRGIIAPYFAVGDAWVDMAWLIPYKKASTMTTPTSTPKPAPAPAAETPKPSPIEAAVRTLPSGKGMYLWIISRIEGGDAKKIAARARELGLQWVAIKITDGVVDYNRRDGKDLAAELFAELRSVGISPWAWSYFYGYNVPKEAAMAIARVCELHPDGFIVNAEREWKKSVRGYSMNSYAIQLMDLLRAGFPQELAIGFSSFRYPSIHGYHPDPNKADLPWREFLSRSDFAQSQVYWMGSQNSAQQLVKSVNEYKAIADIPMIPAGWADHEHGYAPSQLSIDQFHAQVRAMGLPAELWWEWHGAEEHGYMPLIAKHSFTGEVPAPVVVPTPEPIKITPAAAPPKRLVVEAPGKQTLFATDGSGKKIGTKSLGIVSPGDMVQVMKAPFATTTAYYIRVIGLGKQAAKNSALGKTGWLKKKKGVRVI